MLRVGCSACPQTLGSCQPMEWRRREWKRPAENAEGKMELLSRNQAQTLQIDLVLQSAVISSCAKSTDWNQAGL